MTDADWGLLMISTNLTDGGEDTTLVSLCSDDFRVDDPELIYCWGRAAAVVVVVVELLVGMTYLMLVNADSAVHVWLPGLQTSTKWRRLEVIVLGLYLSLK